MIKSFRLQDAFLVAKLQVAGATLDLQERLIHPYTPLRSALLAALFPTRPSSYTYILTPPASVKQNQGLTEGLIQAKARPGRPEQDVVFLAPDFGDQEGSEVLWQRLLIHLCQQAGERGCYRIYARQTIDSPSLPTFKSVGFMPYAEEEILQLFPSGPLQDSPHVLRLRRQTEADSWSVQRLYAAVNPHAVQTAEGLAQGQWQVNNHPFSGQGYQQGFVWESQGEISAVVHIYRGKDGHLLRLLIHPDAVAQTSNLVLTALNMINPTLNKPIYCTLRTYQSEIRSKLIDLGFTSLAKQVVMVKHTTVRARDFLSRLVSAFDSSKDMTQPVAPTLLNFEEVNGSEPGHNPTHSTV